jgi:hypothetical protein
MQSKTAGIHDLFVLLAAAVMAIADNWNYGMVTESSRFLNEGASHFFSRCADLLSSRAPLILVAAIRKGRFLQKSNHSRTKAVAPEPAPVIDAGFHSQNDVVEIGIDDADQKRQPKRDSSYHLGQAVGQAKDVPQENRSSQAKNKSCQDPGKYLRPETIAGLVSPIQE